MAKKKNTNEYRIREHEPNLETAEQMLTNIFEELKLEPASVPLEVMLSYVKYRRERYKLQRVTLVVILILFIMLPLQFIPPTFTVTQLSGTETGVPTYIIKLSGPMPVASVTASVDDALFPVTELGDRVYSVQPMQNGTMNIRVTLSNRQYRDASIQVSNIDTSTPYLVSSNMEDNRLYLYVADDGTGIDYNRIYAEELDGTTVYPSSWNVGTGEIVFDNASNTLNVYIPDTRGNYLHLVLTLN